MYRCVLADPPWSYGDKLRQNDTARSAGDQYRVMTTDDICALAQHVDVTSFRDQSTVMKQTVMSRFVADDAVLALWVTCPFLLNGDGPRVCRAWGFEPKQLFTWVKGRLVEDAVVASLGLGHYFRVDTEHLIIATRGHATELVMRHDLRNYLFLEPKAGHSEKPEEIPELLETLVPGPYLELFARRRRPNWDAVGDQLP